MSNPNITGLEHQIESKRHQIEQSNALDRLLKNKDFQTIVIEGYFKQEAIRLVSAKGARENQAPNIQADILRDMDGIGAFQRHLALISMTGELAADSLGESEALLDSLRADELADKDGE
jgi:hypothetical protein